MRKLNRTYRSGELTDRHTYRPCKEIMLYTSIASSMSRHAAGLIDFKQTGGLSKKGLFVGIF